MTAETISALFASRQRAWNARDIDAFAATYAEDCLVEGQMAGMLRGRQAVADAQRKLFATFPDLALEDEELMLEDGRVMMTATVTGTDERGEVVAPGTAFRIQAVFLFTVHDGRIVAERRLWDYSSFLLKRVESDLRVAAEIQQVLLPQGAYAGNGFEVAAASVPCRAIGGDFFDYFELPNGTFAFALGDIAGKGPPAALLSSSLQAILSVGWQAEGPAATLARANRAMLRRAVPSRFATVFCATLSSDGRLTYSNGGHNPPFVIGPSGTRWLRKGGMFLGMFDQAEFEQETLLLQTGDRVVAFSDGVTEALSADGKEFGEERLVSCVEANLDLAPAALVRRVVETVQDFAAGTKQRDDVTVFVLSYDQAKAGRT